MGRLRFSLRVQLGKEEGRMFCYVGLNVVPWYRLECPADRCGEIAPDGTGNLYCLVICWKLPDIVETSVEVLLPSSRYLPRLFCCSWPVPEMTMNVASFSEHTA